MRYVASSSPDWVKPQNKIGICCFSAEHAALRRKSKDWFARNLYIVSELKDMSTSGLLFQWTSTINIQLIVSSSTKWSPSLSRQNITCSRHDMAENCSFSAKHQAFTDYYLFPGDSRCFVGCFPEIHDVLFDYNVFPRRITCCICSTKTFPILKVYHLFFEDTSFCHDSLTICFLKMSQYFQPRNESIT